MRNSLLCCFEVPAQWDLWGICCPPNNRFHTQKSNLWTVNCVHYKTGNCTVSHIKCVFVVGEQLLQAGEVFSLRPLQLYAVSQQLRLAKPTCCNGDARTDLGHILDFTCRLRYLKVVQLFTWLGSRSFLCSAGECSHCVCLCWQVSGTRGPLGSSNIQESGLPFDLSVFKSLLQIEVQAKVQTCRIPISCYTHEGFFYQSVAEWWRISQLSSYLFFIFSARFSRAACTRSQTKLFSSS